MRTTIDGRTIAQVAALPLRDIGELIPRIEESVPPDTRDFAERLTLEMRRAIDPLVTLGLSYLSLDRAGATLSTGERQRIQLSQTVLARSTGMLFVLDEPTIGLHPANVHGLIDIMRTLVANGNTVLVVDHDVQVLSAVDHLVEMGPGAGSDGGEVVAQGTVAQVCAVDDSLIAPFLTAGGPVRVRSVGRKESGHPVRLRISRYLNLDDVSAAIPTGVLTAVTGTSGAGKTALILDSLAPALTARIDGRGGPDWVTDLDDGGIRQVTVVDATPIGRNSRSTPATYSGVFDPIRKLFAGTDDARRRSWGVGRFSYNTAAGRCPTCQGLGELSLDVQYLPDIPMRCPDCDGRRYNPETLEVTWQGLSIADVLDLSVTRAAEVFAEQSAIRRVLESLRDVGLGYLRLGEPTPALSGGEAQRLQLAAQIRRGQQHHLYIFDEPSIGLHPRDIRTLLGVFDRLLDAGATIIVIEHDTDMIVNADYIIDIGPGAGDEGGHIIATGTVDEVIANPDSRIGSWLIP